MIEVHTKNHAKTLHPKPRITLPELYQIFHIYQGLLEEKTKDTQYACESVVSD
jgi:hypothetical protein